MELFGLVSNLITPITNVIDDLHTTDEEKLEAKRKLYELQSEIFQKALNYEKSIVEAKAKIITAEAQGESWLQTSWRPLSMIFFLFLVGSYWFGYAPKYLINNPDLVDSLLDLVQIGLGGYIVGRSAEKIAPKLKDIIK